MCEVHAEGKLIGNRCLTPGIWLPVNLELVNLEFRTEEATKDVPDTGKIRAFN